MGSIKVTVFDKHFGGYEEKRTINTIEELDALRKEFKNYPQTRDFSTTITFTGFINGEPYVEQIA